MHSVLDFAIYHVGQSVRYSDECLRECGRTFVEHNIKRVFTVVDICTDRDWNNHINYHIKDNQGDVVCPEHWLEAV